MLKVQVLWNKRCNESILTEAMSRRKLDLEMLKMVKSKADAQITLKATLPSPVRLKKNHYFFRLDDVSLSILRFSFSYATVRKRLISSVIEVMLRRELFPAFMICKTLALNSTFCK